MSSWLIVLNGFFDYRNKDALHFISGRLKKKKNLNFKLLLHDLG